ncbi:hypothetical protein CDAR_441121 [Caerostris darwini]|uniref:Uncharacterized protein n=1 Tax=Caerostris darwini TaxID=1538125 RepID=A0AAV4Q734_9ARAC|nr:hypothetical protein CDAR_441121 [Caerostris darwini]
MWSTRKVEIPVTGSSLPPRCCQWEGMLPFPSEKRLILTGDNNNVFILGRKMSTLSSTPPLLCKKFLAGRQFETGGGKKNYGLQKKTHLCFLEFTACLPGIFLITGNFSTPFTNDRNLFLDVWIGDVPQIYDGGFAA